MAQVKPTKESPRFVLNVADGVGEDSLRVVLAYLKAFAGAKEVIMRGGWVKVQVDCGKEVLEKFTELVSSSTVLKGVADWRGSSVRYNRFSSRSTSTCPV